MTLQEFNRLKPGSRIQKHDNKTSHIVNYIEDVQYLDYLHNPPSIRKYRKVTIQGRGRKLSILIDSYYTNVILDIDKWEVVS